MKNLWLPCVCAVVLPMAVSLAAQESPYAGLEGRPIKALSDEQVAEYLEGRGMGLALAAELNGYPGPMHVLELAAELGLSETQLAAVQKIFDAMKADAIELGRRIVDRERGLDVLFAEHRIDEAALVAATEELGRLNGRLRGIHLAAHLETQAVLSGEQRHRYMEARGYAAGMVHDPSRHHR